MQLYLRASRTIATIPDPGDPDFIAQSLEFEVTFDKLRTDVLVISYDNAIESRHTYIVRLEEDNLVVTELNDEFLRALAFSTCGDYVYSGIQHHPEDIQWPKLCGLPDDLLSSRSPGPPHPLALLVDCYYVCAPHIFRLRGEVRTGVMFLDHKLIDDDEETYRSRVICVKPDGLIWRPGMQTVLIWPHDPEGEVTEVGREVKVVIVSEGGPTVIDTGIKSGEMMREDEWFMNIIG
ncbi:hypothetical protein DXG03_008650 [Asterophora parasitica]|uniref:Uncharacterized protein n=1 Tax=Asterophora parasitica TaxID=117018 RepID=A0A9P7KBB5_9AGAR|nr:hypothetical protein DXG03_008650 [Asterophora parasitica]